MKCRLEKCNRTERAKLLRYYPHPSVLKKNKILKMEQESGKCEICKDIARYVHHIDGSKDNHAIENLQVLCAKCHGKAHRESKKGKRNMSSKYFLRYGMTSKELCELLKCSDSTLRKWHKNGEVEYFMGNRRKAVG